MIAAGDFVDLRRAAKLAPGKHGAVLIEATRKQANALLGMGMRIDFKVYDKEHTIDPYREVGDIKAFLTKHLLR